MRAKVLKMNIMSKNIRHNDLEVKCNKTRTAHSQVRYSTFKKIKMNRKVLLIGFILLLFSQTVISQNDNPTKFKFPNYLGYVNDFEGVFSKDQILELNKIIEKQENETSNEIAIVSIESYSPYNTLFEYSLELANYWGIGKQDKNNGILIIFGKNIRQIRIQVGYGLENKLKDEEAKRIIDNIIIPEFKKGDFYTGIKNGLIEIIKEIE